jgi:hypothetical protein
VLNFAEPEIDISIPLEETTAGESNFTDDVEVQIVSNESTE